MVTLKTFKRGIGNGLSVTRDLAIAIVPVYFLITVLKYTPVLEIISKVFEPIMRLVGLPGEASLALVLGNAINLYPAIGVIVSLSLSPKQVTILALMLLLSHSLFIESAVSKMTGIMVWQLVLLRLSLSFISGFILNVIL
ncbi:nucleoside recognition domain-containing protein [Calderihabitans maritimus]|uniref:Nucleoside recognition domain-containing protein n=1 Tax=Calderihabitans maritimus TaxID=1246530 RepID=A0A1Z5HNP4_9FIRM|nr:nucleoside recognition domain-containing protein [Calderihabitans maritimus]GAW91152.1 nucleoside recognition domain-containing protein [Calderihabitans maritimus]